jgi:hypothetical protein
MRKLVLLTLVVTSSMMSWAQNHEPKVKFDRDPSNYTKDVMGGWYNCGEMLTNSGYDVDYFRNHLFPDSTVQVEFTGGMGSVWKHAMGQVFDPAGDIWANGGIVPIDLTDPYTVDSVRIWYQYYRHQTANPDTVKIQIFDEAAMYLYPDPWGTQQSYANADYDSVTNLGIGAVQEYTILLDQDDTITFGQGSLSIAIDMDVNPDEIMAVNVAYFPGNPTSFGDTIDQYMATPPTNQINAFIMYDYWDNSLVNEMDYYNHGLLTPSSVRYNENANGWNGKLYPGIAYFAGTDHSDIGFHVVGTLGIQEENLSDFMLYPNPAVDAINIRLNEGVDLNTVQVMDLSGKDVTSLVSVNGNSINIEGLANGNYFLVHTYNNETTTKKFVVNH